MNTTDTNTATRPDTWLSELAQDESLPNYTSQRGEDRILAKVFEIIGEGSKWCVEFGAADGKRGSNTWHLINDRGWSGVQIEPKHDRDLMLKQQRDTYEALLERYGDTDRVHCLDTPVGFGADDNLDVILGTTATPQQFDLLSVDIDSEDYRVWQALVKYRPRVVVIEHNKTVPIDVDFASSKGSSLRALTRLGKEKGYELVAATMVNGVFVSRELFDQFGIVDNDPAELWRDRDEYSQRAWQLYDGTVIIQGNNKLRWARGVDGTIDGQLASGQFVRVNSGELFESSPTTFGRPSVTGQIRQWLYTIIDTL